MDSLSCLLLVCLRFGNKGAAFPVVCTLIAWPQNALFVFSIAWLCGGFNERDPRSLKLTHSRRQPDKEPPSSHQGPELELPPLFAVLVHGHLVLVDVEQDLLHGGILPCLLLRNRVLLAVGALERLALQVRHIMQTQSCACARQDGAGRRRFRSNNAPSPCLLHGLCLPCGILRIDCKLSGLAG